jgi:PBSX family phage portal protein
MAIDKIAGARAARRPQPRILDAEESILTPRLGKAEGRTLVTDVVDPFTVSGEDLKRVRGIDATTKRRQDRAIKKVYAGHEDSGTKRTEVEYNVNAYNLFGVVLPAHNMDYLAKIYEMSAPHYAAVKAKVANIAGLGFDFVLTHSVARKLAEAEGDKKERMRKKLDGVKEDIYDFLDGTNEEDTFTETLIKVWTDYEVTGNGYIEVGRTYSGSIGYIGHIPASTMRVRKERDGFVQMVSNRAKFFRNFGEDTNDPIGNDPQPNEIIHIKKYSPSNQFYGVPDIVAAQQAIVGNEFAARFNLDYFENKAVPRYVIVVKGASFSTHGEQNLLEFFETGLKGRNHRTVFVPLPADEADRKSSFEMKPVEAGTQDSSFVNYRRGNLSDILMAHRVPVTKISASESNVGLAAARDMDKNFKEQVCRPEQKMLEKKINKIINEITDIFRIKLNELVLTDEDTQSKIDERYLRLGAATVNEVRTAKGQSPLPWGDEKAEIAATAVAQSTQDFQAKQLKLQEKQGDQAAQAKATIGTNATANEQRAQATGNRSRDQARAGNATDSAGEGRNEQGAGRTTA